ncbi:Uncharacterized protein OBRU01_15726 [Operophtera brumata]|uniref:Uncharacterized protein n=1 Tax=Operophtera brumata TaxID=104452 RepID=A0A0L7KTV9_OPEBR|nr:Uncharacterized protein OBRU01_15726 [Operophtera brumata]
MYVQSSIRIIALLRHAAPNIARRRRVNIPILCMTQRKTAGLRHLSWLSHCKKKTQESKTVLRNPCKISIEERKNQTQKSRKLRNPS